MSYKFSTTVKIDEISPLINPNDTVPAIPTEDAIEEV